jgi:uncharacterized membrane protein
MKRFAILLLALCTALTLTLAGCGGGGGGGGGGGIANPAFTTTQDLAAPAGTTPAFSAATAVDDGAGTIADPTMAVGAADNTLPATNLQAVTWAVTGSGATLANTGTPLPVPVGTTYSRANGLNDSTGAIVGEMADATSVIMPAFWADSATIAVELPLGVGATSGAAYAIEDDGAIVGETFAVAGGPATAVFWEVDELGVITGPTPLVSAGTSSSAYAINNNQIVPEAAGEMTDLAGTHAVVWRVTSPNVDPPTITEIVLPGSATLTGDAVAFSINDAGTVIGEIADADGFAHVVRWVKGTGTTYTVQDMGIGSGNAINNGGRVVGSATFATALATTTGASAWGSGGVTPVLMHADLADGVAAAISNTGRAVGVKGNALAFIALP